MNGLFQMEIHIQFTNIAFFMTKILFFLFALCCAANFSSAQNPTFPNNGPADLREGCYALTNATIFKTFREKISNATLLIRNGKIENIGQNISIPKDAIVINLNEKIIYPSFVDMYSDYGMSAAKSEGAAPAQRPQMLSNKRGAYGWNEALKTDFEAYKNFNTQREQAKDYRNSGFGAVLTHRQDGVSRGTGALVALGEQRENLSIFQSRAAHFLSFRKGTSTQDYPTSLTGCIALLRQTYYDGQWYAAQGKKEETNVSLEAWNAVQSLPQVFEAGEKFDILRIEKLGKEFGKQYIVKGNGDEYQRLDVVKATKSPIILGVNFPEALEVEDPYDALNVSIAELKHWELAPSNAGRLAEAGVEIAFTTAGLKKRDDFLGNLRKAVEYGLSEENALKALTFTPAKLLGVSEQLGSLEVGKVANFIVTSGNIFSKETKIYQNWVQGKIFVINELVTREILGIYKLQVATSTYQIIAKGNAEKPTLTLRKLTDTTDRKIEWTLKDDLISLSFNPDGKLGELTRLSGTFSKDRWSGRGTLPDGTWADWSASLVTAPNKEEKKDSAATKPIPVLGELTYPFMAFGRQKIPVASTVLFKNATVWTNEKDGILKNCDILIQNGKINKIGKNLTAPADAATIDGTGKHLTAGIIDEHSHIAIKNGVNEASQESTAEVCMGDVIQPEDINIYRQLAGGVTTSHILHGSANPIGGQTTLIKLRWGYLPEAMKVAGADGFIKFALGENVKHSNWGDTYTVRFPQTRMGVEQVFEDYFGRAEEYLAAKKTGKILRKDLDIETIAEILEGKRFITCHSYVQSEINMLMRLAERHRFKVNTFTHILEGYKVADKMAQHGAAASTFADWWAYKYEVIDAIPYNAALMYRQKVLVGINSDDAEMARRLNQEAAKTILYGNVPEEDALKFVTLNPAKMLHIDQQTGSIKEGKDADLVLWDAAPLSVYAKAELTFVDGIKFFDRAEDQQMQVELRKERNRIIQKMILVKKNGGAVQPVQPKPKKLYHCDDVECEIF